MKRCPLCKTTYPDDANFCPMDAGRLEVVAEAPPPQAAAAQNLLGGRFQVGPQIGGHRTGQVFAGSDLTTGREVAIKFAPSAVFHQPLVAQRTERELKQLMKVHSDRVAMVLDVGKHGDYLWLATELIHGRTLADIIQAHGPLPVEHAVRLAVEVGEGLAEAAKLGVIHRDVSPKNVLVLPDGRVKLINFGIPTPITDRVSGIPEFLSPEQAEGKPVDQRSNIYSLATLITFMLTAQPLFAGDVDSVLKQQLGAPPVLPPERGVPAPPELVRLLAKALEKQSSRRHLTLRQLVSELEAVIGMHPAPMVHAAAQRTIMGVHPNAAAHPPAETMLGVPAPVVHAQPATMMVETAPTAPVQQRTQQFSPPAPTMPAPAPPGPSPYAQTHPSVPVYEPPAPTYQPPAPAYQPPAYQPPAPAYQPPVAGKGKARPPSAKEKDRGKFRETMWFKKGELDEAVAAAAVSAAPGAEPAPEKVDALPMEDRYKDDGTLTAADRQRLSLRTGGTQMHQAVAPPVVPGERMGEYDLAKELGAGRGRRILLILAAVALIAIVVIYFGVIRK